MPNEGKRQFAMTQNEREAKTILWSTQSDKALKRIRLSSPEAAAFLGVSERKMQEERSQAKEAKDNGFPINPAELRSIPFGDTGMIQYSAFHLLEYLDRTSFEVGSGRRMPDHLKGAGARTKKVEPDDAVIQALTAGTVSRFMGWMQTTNAEATWPFSIQSDGRPLDLHTAMVEGKLTEKAERLNIREFANMLADAASSAFFKADAIVLEDSTPQAIKPDDEPVPATGSGSTRVRV